MSAAFKIRLVECLYRIKALNFNENDLRSLYLLLREKSDPNSYTKEIANFFAHPDRDRGLIHKSIELIVNGINSALNKRPYNFTVAPISHIEIMRDLNREIWKHGIPGIHEERFDSVALVILVALQASSIDLSKSSKVSIHLFVFEDNEIALCAFKPSIPGSEKGVMFPIITMPNSLGLNQFMLDPGQKGNTMLNAAYIDGELKVTQLAEPVVFIIPRYLGPE